MNAMMPKATVLYSAGSIRSASIVVPQLMQLLPDLQSVVEVGPVDNAWSGMFERQGVPNVECIVARGGETDDLPSVSKLHLLDLHRPFSLKRRFELCVAVQSAGRIHALESEAFVQNLCGLSDVVLFSCADPDAKDPLERGMWLSTWVQLFDAQGYEFRDFLRPDIWFNPRFDWRLAETLACFVRRDSLAAGKLTAPQKPLIDVIHPWALLQVTETERADSLARTGLEAERIQNHATIADLQREVEEHKRTTLKERQNAEEAWAAHNRVWNANEEMRNQAVTATTESTAQIALAERLRGELASLNATLVRVQMESAGKQQAVAEIEAKMAAVQRALAEARAELVTARTSAGDLQSRLTDANTRLVGLEGRLASVSNELALTRAAEAAVKNANSDSAHLLREATRSLAVERMQSAQLIVQMKSDIEALRGSTSWRLTAPLRKAMSLARGKPAK